MKARTPASLHRAHIREAQSGSHSFASRPGDDRETMRRLIDRYSMWAYRCINLNAQVAAAVPFKLFSTRGPSLIGKTIAGAKVRQISPRTKRYLMGNDPVIQPSQALSRKVAGQIDDMAEIESHPLLDLLADVNDWTDGCQWRTALYADLQLFGRSFTLLIESGKRVTDMWRMAPHVMRVIPSREKFVDHFEHGEGDAKVSYTADEVLWIRHWDPWDPWGGVGPTEAWLKTIDSAKFMEETRYWQFQRHGAPDWAVVSEGTMEPKEKEAFRSEWRRMFGRAWRRIESVIMLTGKPKAELQRLNDSPKELEFNESSGQVRDMIGQAYGVPKSLLTTDDVNRSNGRESNEMHISSTIWPMIQMVEDVWNERLAPKFGDGLVLVHENPVPEDREIRIEERRSLLESGTSINEVRMADGMETLDDPMADEALVASGLQVLSALDPANNPLLAFGGELPIGNSAPSNDTENDDSQDDPQDVVGDKSPRGRGRRPPRRSRPSSIVSQAALWMKMYGGTLNGSDGCCEVKAETAQEDLPKQPKFSAVMNLLISRHLLHVASTLERRGVEAAREVIAAQEWVVDLASALRPNINRLVDLGGKAGMGKAGLNISFEVVNPAVEEFIAGYTVRLANQVAGSTNLLASEILDRGLQGGVSAKEVAIRLRDMDSKVTGARAEMIARTESARAFVEGEREAWASTGQVGWKEWLLAPNACEFCEATFIKYKNEKVPLDKAFWELGSVVNGTKGGRLKVNYQTVMGPPLHPHDRCDLLPVLVETT